MRSSNKPSLIRALNIPFLRNVSYDNLVILFAIIFFVISITTYKSEKVRKLLDESFINTLRPLVNIIVTPANFTIKLIKNTSSFFTFISEKRELEENNMRLQIDLLKLSGIENENKEIRNMLKFSQNFSGSITYARIFFRPSNNFVFYINKGSQDGIQKDSLVINQHGLIGKVQTVYQNSSLVYTLFHERIGLPVVIKDKDISGITESEGNKILLDHIQFPVEGLNIAGITPQENTTDIQNEIVVSNDNLELGIIDNSSLKSLIKDDDIVLTSPKLDIMIPYLPVGRIKQKDLNTYEIKPFGRADNTIFVAVISKTYLE